MLGGRGLSLKPVVGSLRCCEVFACRVLLWPGRSDTGAVAWQAVPAQDGGNSRLSLGAFAGFAAGRGRF
eukprot:15484657-Alexandrium_andersonii.AAC.1